MIHGFSCLSHLMLNTQPDTGKYDKRNTRAHKRLLPLVPKQINMDTGISWQTSISFRQTYLPKREISNFCFISASPHRLFSRNLPHNRVDAERPSQDHRQSAAPQRRPHQGVPLSDPPGRQVPSQLPHHPQGHQARQSLGKLQLCSENLWFRPSKVSNRNLSHNCVNASLCETVFQVKCRLVISPIIMQDFFPLE